MAFKQKGSPFQRNFNIGSSPAKQTSPIKSEGGWLVNKKAKAEGKTTWGHGTPETGYVEYDNKGRIEHTKAEHRRGAIENPVDDTGDSGLTMKSPLEQGVDTKKMARETNRPGISKTIRDYISSIGREKPTKGGARKLRKAASVKGISKSALKQDKIKFGYHDEEGNVIADATKDVVPAETGIGSFTKKRDDSGSDRATYQKKVSDMVRQTAQGDWKEEEKAKKKKSKGGRRRSKMKSKSRRPKSSRGINLVTGGTTRTSGRTGRTTQYR